MRIGLYNEPFGGGLGGSELSVGVLAAALGETDDVEIVHHRPAMTAPVLAAHCGVNLGHVSLRCVPYDAAWMSRARDPLRHYREIAGWHAELSRPYDLFVCFTHGIPPFCHAARGALMVLFPSQPRAERAAGDGTPAGRLNTVRRDWEWRARMRTYPVRLCNSDYTKHWTERWWDVTPDVLYPPVDTAFDVCAKEDAILSVGRFSVHGHPKRQWEMVGAFGAMPDLAAAGWRYACVGGLSDQPDDRQYFADVCAEGEGRPIRVEANLERAALRGLYARAKIFWHAAGFGDDPEAHPEQAEHFGIATVEAMAAGCVPVVINKGGQPEIVQHGVSGFVWETLDELRDHTRRLVADDALRARMADAARARAQDFTREKYLARFRSVLGLKP